MPYTRMAIPLRSIATGEGNVSEKEEALRRTILAMLILTMVTSCSPSDSEKPAKPKTEPARVDATSGRVQLLKYKVEFGEVDDALIKEGMKQTLQALEAILQEELKVGRDVHGLLEGSFRLEPNGVVRMYLEGKSSLSNEGETTIADKLTEAVFGKKVAFPSLGQPCLVSWKIEIQKGKR